MDHGTIALGILGVLGLFAVAAFLLLWAASIPYDHR